MQIMKPGFTDTKGMVVSASLVSGIRIKQMKVPVWLFSLILGIMSYLVVLYYLAHPRLF